MKKLERDYFGVAVNLLIFAGLVYFFTRVSPLVMLDTDDWYNISMDRLPIPQWGIWNPSRVFPETFMSLCGKISGFVIYPITKDYLLSITIVSAVAGALLITALCMVIRHFLVVRLGADKNAALFYEVVFICLHFVIFRNRANSRCMFTTEDLSCFYNYTLCGVLNEIVVVIMMTYESFEDTFKQWKMVKKIAFIALMYLACFSHLFHSEMVGIFCFLMILKRIFFDKKRNLSDIGLYICGCIFWAIAILFEMFGGRSAKIQSQREISFLLSLNQFKAMILAFSKAFKIISAIALIGMAVILILSLKKKNDHKKLLPLVGIIAVNEMAVVIFLLLLNSLLQYMSRIQATYTIWSYLILLVTIGVFVLIAAIKEKLLHTNAQGLYLAACVVLLVLVWFPDGNYLISTVHETDYDTCRRAGNFIIDQIIAAAENDDGSRHKIIIPMYKDEGYEWVFAHGGADGYVETLYKHGVIDHKVSTTVECDYEFFD